MRRHWRASPRGTVITGQPARHRGRQRAAGSDRHCRRHGNTRPRTPRPTRISKASERATDHRGASDSTWCARHWRPRPAGPSPSAASTTPTASRKGRFACVTIRCRRSGSQARKASGRRLPLRGCTARNPGSGSTSDRCRHASAGGCVQSVAAYRWRRSTRTSASLPHS